MRYSDINYASLVELDDFIRFADKHLTEDEYNDLTLFLSVHPEHGVIIPGTGGVRKLRWAAKGKGKSGGARIIYYYHNMEVPLFLMTGYAKNVQADITPAQKKQMKAAIPELVKIYQPRHRT